MDFSISIRATRKSETLEPLASIFLESLDALLGAAIDAFCTPDESELDRLWKATHSRSDQMRAIRKRMLSGSQSLDDDERLNLISLTNDLERTVWILHEFISELIATSNQGEVVEIAS